MGEQVCFDVPAVESLSGTILEVFCEDVFDGNKQKTNLTISKHTGESVSWAVLQWRIGMRDWRDVFENPQTLHVGMTGKQDGSYTQLAWLQREYLRRVKISFTNQ